MDDQPQSLHRHSLRLKGYDYTQSGVYFVTLCSYRRRELFGILINSEMHLSPLGKIIQSEWLHSVEMRREIHLFKDELVIMPNHFHGIVWIVDPEPVGADGIRPEIIVSNGMETRGTRRVPLRRVPRSLASFLAGFKASVTKHARMELGIGNVWQRNYYDHIIRNQADLEGVWNYIDANPFRWQDDQLHPSALEKQAEPEKIAL